MQTLENAPENRLDFYRAQEKASSAFAKQAEHLGRIAALALSLYVPQQAHAAESTNVNKDVLSVSESSGTVELASGESIEIPKPGGYFNDVHVYRPKDAPPKRMVILFKQTHDLPAANLRLLDQNTRDEFLDNLLTSQRNIYTALKQLAQDHAITKVCGEGILDTDRTDQESMEKLYQDFLPVLTSHAVAKYLPTSEMAQVDQRWEEIFAQKEISEADLQELDASIYPAMRTLLPTYKYVIGAVNILAGEGTLAACAASDTATYTAAFDDKTETIWDKSPADRTPDEKAYVQKVIFDDREDAALSLAVKEGDASIAIEYGAAHTFVGALERWNAGHPAMQLGLVTVEHSKENN